jgi:hypothetical protein
MLDLTEIHCDDYVKDGKVVRKGCGKLLRWPTDEEKAKGLKRPLNIDGTEHRHEEAKPAPKVFFNKWEGLKKTEEIPITKLNEYLDNGWKVITEPYQKGTFKSVPKVAEVAGVTLPPSAHEIVPVTETWVLVGVKA